jgi:uncharacterized membrane protein YadS
VSKLKWVGWFILSALAILAITGIVLVIAVVVEMIKYLIAFLLVTAFVAYCLKNWYAGRKK